MKRVHISTSAKRKQAQYIHLPSSVTVPGLLPKWKHTQICNANIKCFKMNLFNIELCKPHIENQ